MDQSKIHGYYLVLDTFNALLGDKSFVESQTANAITRLKSKREWLMTNEASIMGSYMAEGYLGMFDNMFDQDGLLYAYKIMFDLMEERETDKHHKDMFSLVQSALKRAYDLSGKQEGDVTLTTRKKVHVAPDDLVMPTPTISAEALQNNSYSGVDMVATVQLPGGKAMVLGELASVNYSVYREKMLVRSLGSVRPKGVSRGQRTISGILEFTNFDRSIAYKVLSEYYEMGYHILMDELPQFDITITMANETGQRSVFRIYGVSTFTEGGIMSIDQVTTRSSYEFYALDIDPMAPLTFGKGMKIGGYSA